jgi:hypothetical protein
LLRVVEHHLHKLEHFQEQWEPAFRPKKRQTPESGAATLPAGAAKSPQPLPAAHPGFKAPRRTANILADPGERRPIADSPVGYGNEAMAGPVLSNRSGRTIGLSLAIAVAVFSCSIAPLARAASEDDLLQQAVNYVFTGRIDPSDAPEIVDRKSCVVVLPDPKYKRYARYYLSRFKMDIARISKRYAGPQVLYELEVQGDDVLLEYLNTDKKTVTYGFRSAQISLPGNIDQTEKALKLIFSGPCKADKPKAPF